MTETSMRPVGPKELERFIARLALPSTAASDEARIDRIRALERLKNATSAAQATDTVAFADSQIRSQISAGVHSSRLGRGVADQVALARMESPHRGSRLLGLARSLVHELPHCFAALQRGEVSEWKVCGVLREIIHLDLADRQHVDSVLGPILKDLGVREAAGRARTLAQQLDPAGAVERNERAVTERRVSIRPAPEAMAYVTALLPMREGVSVIAALKQLAKDAITAGAERGEGQLMADSLVERVTGRQIGSVPFRLCLVMSDLALVGGDGSAASIPGYGTVPGGVARQWLRQLLARTERCVHDRSGVDGPGAGRPTATVVDYGDLVLVNRLFASPDGRDLVAMESTQRGYDGLLRLMVALRDQRCRTPFCDAPIRHTDHVQRYEDGGATSYPNGRGLCARCNHAREVPGWHAEVLLGEGASHQVLTRTPTGHTYTATSPPLTADHIRTADHSRADRLSALTPSAGQLAADGSAATAPRAGSPRAGPPRVGPPRAGPPRAGPRETRAG